MKRYLLIDGSSVLHRVLYTSLSELDNGLLHGFLRSLIKLLKDCSYNCQPIVCWDKGHSIFRTSIFQDYKSWKSKPIEDPKVKDLHQLYISSRHQINEFLNMVGIISILESNYEGDDLIAYAKLYYLKDKGGKIHIVTEDSDLLQLLDEDTLVIMPVRDKVYTLEEFISKYELMPEDPINNFIAIKAMEGDGSDGIDGIKGIGGVNARRIYKILKTEGLVRLKVSSNSRDRLFVENYDKFLRNIKLIDLHYSSYMMKNDLEDIFKRYVNNMRKDFYGGMAWLKSKSLNKVLEDYSAFTQIRYDI